jgi:hypothetical protein
MLVVNSDKILFTELSISFGALRRFPCEKVLWASVILKEMLVWFGGSDVFLHFQCSRLISPNFISANLEVR